MATAPGGDLAPLLLAPPEREKKGPSYPYTPPATATAGWSLLPDDLVRRIADSFLDTNDIDCDMCFLAVCLSWRAATDDPRNPTSSLARGSSSTRPKASCSCSTPAPAASSRRSCRCHCYVVASTPSGFFVLADMSPPHAARLFNPLTGVLTRFAAPMPPEARVADIGHDEHGSLAILLLGDSSRKAYMAAPDSEGFDAKDYLEGAYNLFRNAVVGGAYEHISGPAFACVFAGLFDFLRSLHADPLKVFSTDYPGDADDIHCFLVGLDAYMVVVMKTHGLPDVFKVYTEIGKLETAQSIGRFAIFIGRCRCLSVDATKFPGIEANCVYYTQHVGSSAHIYKYNLKEQKAERISEAAEFVKQEKQFALVTDRPFTTIQLLCSYTINVPDSQLALQQMS